MALNPSQQWWIRISGNELNGGGFDDTVTSPGVNRANSDTAHVTFNGGGVTATTAGVGATITITGHTVSADDVGNTLRIASGTNFTAGYYTIVSVNTGANTWTLDRNCTSGAGSALVGRMGGAHAGFINYSNGGGGSAPALATPLIPGNVINVRGTSATPSAPDYLQTSYYNFPSGDETDGPIRVRGYNGRPALYSTDSLMFINVLYWVFESIAIVPDAAGTFPTFGVIATGSGDGLAFYDCYFDQAGFDVTLVTGINIAIDCAFVNTGSTSSGSNPVITTFNSPTLFHGCVFLDLRGVCVSIAGALGTFVNTIVARCAASPAIDVASSDAHLTPSFVGCSFVGNTGDAVELSSAGAVVATSFRNCIFSDNGGWGINASVGTLAQNDRRRKIVSDYNAYYNNSSGDLNGLSAGPNDVTLTGDPFTNAAGDDFSLNNTAGAGAACRSAAQPGAFPAPAATTSYLDLGAAQHLVVALLAFGAKLIFRNRDYV